MREEIHRDVCGRIRVTCACFGFNFAGMICVLTSRNTRVRKLASVHSCIQPVGSPSSGQWWYPGDARRVNNVEGVLLYFLIIVVFGMSRRGPPGYVPCGQFPYRLPFAVGDLR